MSESDEDIEDRVRCVRCQRVTEERINRACVDIDSCDEEFEANENLRRMLQAFVQARGGI